MPKAELSEQQRAACPDACKGAYVLPARADSDADLHPGRSDLRGEADSIELNTELNRASMQGGVVFTQGWRELKSDQVDIDRNRGSLTLNDNVSIREPGILLTGESAQIEMDSDHIQIEQAQYLIYEQRIRGTAASISRAPESGLVIDSASYTACEPGDQAWVLYADRIAIDESSGRASAKGVRIETSGIPVFYAPYFNFVIDDRRASGLLYPAIGHSNDEGLSYSQPVYWNIAANQDLTITPRYTAKRGSGLEAEHRLLTGNSYSSYSAAYFADDDINLEYPDNRWAAQITHRSSLDFSIAGLSTEINFADVSDDDFLEDWDSDVIQASSRDLYLRQQAGVSLKTDHWTLTTSASGYQSLIDDNQDQYRELPRIALDARYSVGDNVQIQLENEWTHFDHAQDQVLNSALGFQLSNNGTWVTGKRLRSDWSLAWRNESAWGYFNPKVGLNYLGYDLDDALLGNSDSSPDAIAAEASIDSGLIFERRTSLMGKGVFQTLEPRLNYLYREGNAQNDLPVFDTSLASDSLDQLFRDSDFIGGDRLEESNRLSLGLWSRFYDSVTHREIFSVGIGQRFYLSDRTTHIDQSLRASETNPNIYTDSTVARLFAEAGAAQLNELQRNRSDIISEAVWSLSRSLSVKGSLFWDDRQSDLERSRLELAYRPESNRSEASDNFLKIAYAQQDNASLFRDLNENAVIDYGELSNENIEQLSASGQWSLNERWKMIFLWREDLENSRNLDKIAGVSYQSCCWNLSLSWRSELQRLDSNGLITEDLRKDSSIMLSFEFSGLGGLGTSAGSLLADQ